MAKMSLWARIKQFFTGKKSAPTVENAQVKDGIWYAKQSDGTYLLGIDKSVYQLMGKITFADFPTQLKEIQVDDDLLDIEGDKSVETLKSPIAGTVIAQNHDIGKNVETLNEPNPQVNWIVKVKPAS